MEEYSENDMSVIPVFRTITNGGFSGKVTRIKGWQEYSNRLPTEAERDAWKTMQNISGIALVLGPKSNICAMDIDTDDPRILAKMQQSPCVKRGKKGETRFFRRKDLDDQSYPEPPRQIVTVKRDGKATVEFFFANKYVVIPPSLHSQNGNADPLFFKWTSMEQLIDIDLYELPVFDPGQIALAESLCQETNFDQNKPLTIVKNGDYEGDRYNDMKTLASKLIAFKTPLEEAIQSLLDHDESRNKMNPYFADKSKGHRTDSMRINAMKYYCDILAVTQINKPHDKIELPKPTVVSVLIDGLEWEEPLPISFEQIIPDMSIDLVPEIMRPWILWQKENLGVDLAPVYYKAETALSGLIGNKVEIQPKENDFKWKEAANLWTMFIAPPGRKKSPITNSVLSFVQEIEKEIVKKSHKQEMENNEKRCELAAIIKHKEKYLHRALIEGCEQEAEQARKELAELKIEESAIFSCRPQIIVNSLTMQKLGNILVENPSGVLMNVDELGQLWKNMEKETSGLLRGFLLQAWGGLSSYRHQTVGGSDFNIEHLCISLMANVQPSLFSHMISEQIRQNSDDGFLQRSSICFDSGKIRDFKDAIINPKDLERAKNLYWRAYNINPAIIKFSKPAQAFLVEYNRKLDKMIIKEEMGIVAGFLSKFRGLLVKKAFLIDFIHSDEVVHEVSLRGVQMAEKQLDLNYKNIKIAMLSPAFDLAKSFIAEIKDCTIESGINISQLSRNYKRYFANRFISDTMFKLLERNNYIKIHRVGNAKKLLVNPCLYQDMPKQN